MNWIQETFNTNKPIIAMCHFKALPGDPGYDKAGGMKKVVEAARHDLLALQEGGVDAVMFSNEFSLPYLTDVHTVTVAAMARVIGELMDDIEVPYGVNVLWDPKRSLDLAAAVDAKFVREIFTGVYASDFGLWNTNCGEAVRHQHAIGAENVKLLFNIVPEAAKYLADRDLVSVAKSTVFNAKPDGLCVSGLTAGAETDAQLISLVKQTVPQTAVFANTGVRMENVEEQLSIADGAVVGTAFKVDGVFENPVDVNRVKPFMDKVKAFRKNL
ncbi:MAG: BtpA/SgcQ family protein [Bacillota bacterium]|jgi:membrane complex biogenesis BtpA family protein|nr:BtpA/SgcQ family protein [Bacillota bacterium]NLJ02550.1 BtpA/SgcQ family protein [Bacillota bacterium]